MNEEGGIVDDTVITNAGDHIYMVVNGACKVLGIIKKLFRFHSSVFESCEQFIRPFVVERHEAF